MELVHLVYITHDGVQYTLIMSRDDAVRARADLRYANRAAWIESIDRDVLAQAIEQVIKPL